MALDPDLLDESQPAINEDSVDHGCFGCGDGNPQGLRLRFRPLPDGGVWARFTPTGLHQGYMAMTHGGILATVLDEAMSWALTHNGDLGVTARMSLSFRRPATVGEPLLVAAHVGRSKARLVDATATAYRERDGEVVAEAEGRFMRVTAEQAAEWRTLYAANDPESAFGRAADRMSTRRSLPTS